MIWRPQLAALCLVLCLATTSGRARAADMLDLIPADALGGVACRSIEGLVQKTTKLIKDTEIKVPEQPGAICKQIFMALGIQAGLDTKGGCSAVLVNEKHIGEKFKFAIFGGGNNAEKFVVLTIPFSDLDAMAGNFGIGQGKLKPD